jgi:AraC-type DNA-binding domain-containing proteins
MGILKTGMNHGKTGYRLLNIYILVFLVPLVIFSSIYSMHISRLTDTQYRSIYTQNLKATKSKIQNWITDIRYVLTQLSMDQKVTSIYYIKENYETLVVHYPYEVSKAIEEIRNTILLKKNITSAAVFFPISNTVIDNTRSYYAINYSESHFKSSSFINKWYVAAENFTFFDILYDGMVNYGNKSNNSFVFYRTIPIDTSNPAGLVAVFCRTDILEQYMNHLPDNVSAAFIINDKNVIIAKTANMSEDIILFPYDKYTSVLLEDKGYTSYSEKMDFLPWKIVLIVRNNTTSIQAIIDRIWLIFLFASIVGFAIVFFIYRFNTKNTKLIFGYTEINNSSINLGSFKEIHSKIIDKIQTIRKYEKKIADLSIATAPILKRSLSQQVTGLLLPLNGKSIIRNELFGDIMKNNTYLVLIRQINTGKDEKYSPNTIGLLEQKLFAYTACYDINGNMLFHVENESDVAQYAVELSSLLKVLAQQTGYAFYSGMAGPFAASFDSLKAYNITLKHLSHSILHGLDMTFEIIDKSIFHTLAPDIEMDIEKSIIGGDLNKLETVLEKVKNGLHGENPLSLSFFEEFRYLLLQIIGKNNNDYFEDLKLKINLSNTLDVIFEIAKEMCKRIIHLSQDIQKNRTAFKDNVLDFIADNLMNENLSLKLVADKFGISMSFVTKIVEEHTGTGFLQYVKHKKIEYAKDLLADPCISVKEIASNCGYIDSSAFITDFKRHEGITPGEFKKLQKLQRK